MAISSQVENTQSLRILVVATKPPFPPTDGGKLLMWNTIKGLAGRGHRVTFISPHPNDVDSSSLEMIRRYCSAQFVRCRPGGLIPSMIRAQLTGRPLSILRHSYRRLQRAVSDELALQSYDVVHAEQVQALYNIPPSAALPPLVLRAQNVESHLWRMVGAARPMFGFVARHEARKMAVIEAEALRRADMTMVLTRDDGMALAGGLGMAARRIRIVPPPFPDFLPISDEPMRGDPAIVLLGGGWLPNRDSIRWFFESIWSRILADNPGAHAHVFGADHDIRQPSTTRLPSPNDSQKLFHKGAILVVPLRIASGIRMKIIEAWARGVPVVATPEAVKGLEVRDAEEALLARDGPEFAEAIRRLREDPGLRRKLVEAGRSRLSRHFDPTSVSESLVTSYSDVISSAAG